MLRHFRSPFSADFGHIACVDVSEGTHALRLTKLGNEDIKYFILLEWESNSKPPLHACESAQLLVS